MGWPRSQAIDRLVCRYVRLLGAGKEQSRFTLVEGVADGWWYLAALPSGEAILAFHTDADLPAARQSCEPDGFSAMLAQTAWVSEAVGPIGPTVRIGRIGARSECAPNPCGEDWCLVGDAVMAFDPLSAQGLFNAMYTGVRGAEAVLASFSSSTRLLTAYRDRLWAVWNAYRRDLGIYYQAETRFRSEAFWQRRLA
jgi:2-polyprenyl-6-methoxyphenol hydroxylase-like FAD-dependent oxidoreductase